MVNATTVARSRGIEVTNVTHEHVEGYQTLVTIVVTAEGRTRTISGTLFQGSEPRVTSIRGTPLEARLAPHMLYIRNTDRPGFIGALGRTLGDNAINIATFHLGRDRPGGDAVALVEVDGAIPDEVLAAIGQLPGVLRAKPLRFTP